MKLQVKDIDDGTWSIIYDDEEIQKLSKSSVFDFDNCFGVNTPQDSVNCFVELIDYNIHHKTIVVKDPNWHLTDWEINIKGILTKEEIEYLTEIISNEYAKRK